MIKSIVMLFVMTAMPWGCAPRYQLAHPTKTHDDYESDRYDCELIATQHTNNMGFRGNVFIIADEITKCMILKKGWKQYPAPGR